MTTHLVLGGSGFIGRHVVAALARRGDAVIVADRAPPPSFPPDIPAQAVAFVPLDLATQDWAALTRGSDVVHHYVWSTVPQSANEDPLADLDTNLRATVRLLEALRGQPGKRLVFASSGGTVYGKLTETPVHEDHALAPLTAYGVSKLAAEKYIGFYRSQHGVDGRIARLSNPFGAGQNLRRNLGAVSIFLAHAMAGEPITIWGDGTVVRDYLHITDVTQALLALADAPGQAVAEAPVFNVASGEGRSLNQIVSAIGALLGRAPFVEYKPARPFDVPVSILNVDRAARVLGWRPHLGFEEGLSRMYRDLQAGRTFYSGV